MDNLKKIKDIFSDYKNNSQIQDCYICKIEINKKLNKLTIILKSEQFVQIKDNIRPPQVTKNCARFSTTPSLGRSSSRRGVCRRAETMRRALTGPMPGTRSRVSRSALRISTGNCSRWHRAQWHLGSSRGLKSGWASSSSSWALKP